MGLGSITLVSKVLIYICIAAGISGPLLAIYCINKKPISIFLKRIALAALLVWTFPGIRLIVGYWDGSVFGRHSISVTDAIAMGIFLLVAFCWGFVFLRTRETNVAYPKRRYFK